MTRNSSPSPRAQLGEEREGGRERGREGGREGGRQSKRERAREIEREKDRKREREAEKIEAGFPTLQAHGDFKRAIDVSLILALLNHPLSLILRLISSRRHLRLVRSHLQFLRQYVHFCTSKQVSICTFVLVSK